MVVRDLDKCQVQKMGQAVKRQPQRHQALNQVRRRLARLPEPARLAPVEVAPVAAPVRPVAIVVAIVTAVGAAATVTVTAVVAVAVAVAVAAVAAAEAAADQAAVAVAVVVVDAVTAGADEDEGETLLPRRAALAVPLGTHVPRGVDAGGENAIRLKNLL